jgi:hypothetical protein
LATKLKNAHSVPGAALLAIPLTILLLVELIQRRSAQSPVLQPPESDPLPEKRPDDDHQDHQLTHHQQDDDHLQHNYSDDRIPDNMQHQNNSDNKVVEKDS